MTEGAPKVMAAIAGMVKERCGGRSAAVLCAALAAILLAGAGEAVAKKRQSKKPRPRPAAAAVPLPVKKPVAEAPAGPEPAPVVIELTGNKALYQKGDKLELRVKVDQDCHLTLIDIEPGGTATVLFPNDFEQENRLASGTTLTVPGANAGYAFRLETPGVETVLAICSATARRPFGIGHDFERQPFTLIGDWAAFSRSQAEHEKEVERQIAEKNRKLKRRRGKKAVLIVDPPPGPREAEGRSILLLAVEAGDVAATPSTSRGP